MQWQRDEWLKTSPHENEIKIQAQRRTTPTHLSFSKPLSLSPSPASRAEPALRLPVQDQARLPAPHPRILADYLQEAFPRQLPRGPVPCVPGGVPVSPRRRESLQEGEREGRFGRGGRRRRENKSKIILRSRKVSCAGMCRMSIMSVFAFFFSPAPLSEKVKPEKTNWVCTRS